MQTSFETLEIEEAWATETERRISEIEAGTVQLIPAAEAIANARTAMN
jgi:hypothetical protein